MSTKKKKKTKSSKRLSSPKAKPVKSRSRASAAKKSSKAKTIAPRGESARTSKPRKKNTLGATATDDHGNTWSRIVPGTDKDLRAAESTLGVEIPDDAASLFKDFGAGRPARDYYFNRANDIEVSIGYVLPLTDTGKVSGLVTTCTRYRNAQGLSPALLPFALDNGHANLLCIRLPERDVVYWLHDDADDRVRKVAPSLEAFLSGLSEPPF